MSRGRHSTCGRSSAVRKCGVEQLEDRRLLATAGTLDPSFGGDGHVNAFLGVGTFTNAVAVQSDGKTVVVGRAGNDLGIARFSLDGTLDPTFGPNQNGMVRSHFGNA